MLQALAKEWLGGRAWFRKRWGLAAEETENTPQAINGCGAGLDVHVNGGQAPFVTWWWQSMQKAANA
ncbi:hypothetical protein ACXZ7E_26760 [Paenibacillus lautus]